MGTSPLELEVLCELLCRPLRDGASDFFINDTTSSGVFHFIDIGIQNCNFECPHYKIDKEIKIKK